MKGSDPHLDIVVQVLDSQVLLLLPDAVHDVEVADLVEIGTCNSRTHTLTPTHTHAPSRRHSLLTVPKGLCDRRVQGAIAVRHRVLRREGERPAQVLGGDGINGERHDLNELGTKLCRQPGALRNGEEERVERLPRIGMAGNAEDVLVRREHLQNGETNTNGQRLPWASRKGLLYRL